MKDEHGMKIFERLYILAARGLSPGTNVVEAPMFHLKTKSRGYWTTVMTSCGGQFQGRADSMGAHERK